MASGNSPRPFDDVHTCGRDQKTLTNVGAGSSVTIPFSNLLLRNGHSYLVTIIGDNNAWRYAGIIYKNGPTYAIDSFKTYSYVDVSVDSTNITVTNTHPQYSMTLTVEFIGLIL